MASNDSPAAPAPQPAPTLTAAYPQLFVTNLRGACEYYERVLGFSTAFVHGEPPLYAQVGRDHARLNLRAVDQRVFNDDLRKREHLLSAYVAVTGVRVLYEQFAAAGASFHQELQAEPWGVQDFIVRDPDGNLLCFAE
jgi:uncharacterized glyoxalase superfamily protein PhnB